MFETTVQQGSTPPGSLMAAVSWVQGLLLGNLGTAFAVLAVAGIGFGMLRGRLSPRAGLQVVLGCFILFGAPAIANGLADLFRGTGAPAPAPIGVPPPPLAVPSPPPSNPDPYAGASLPM